MNALEQLLITEDPDTMDDDDLYEWSLANIMTAWAKLQNTDLPDLKFEGMFHVAG